MLPPHSWGEWQGWMHCILYVLFENAMGIVKLGAVVAGQPSSTFPQAEMHEVPMLALHDIACCPCTRSSCPVNQPRGSGKLQRLVLQLYLLPLHAP